MDYRRCGNAYWVRIDRGEEILASLKNFALRERVFNAAVSGIGAAGRAVVGLYDTRTHCYLTNTFEGEFEIVSLLGSITSKDGEPYLHLHIGLGDEAGVLFGGHLTEAVISGTCEIEVRLTDGFVSRRFDDGIGLNLMEFSGYEVEKV